MKSASLIRGILTGLLLVEIYREAGFYTAVFAFLVAAWIENRVQNAEARTK